MIRTAKKLLLSILGVALLAGASMTAEVKAAEPTKDEKKLIKEVRDRIENGDFVEVNDFEEYEPWAVETIVGWQFTPDAKLKKKIDTTEESVLDENFSLFFDKKNTKLSEKEFNEAAFLITSQGLDKDVFKLYSVRNDNYMYVVTPDGQYVEILVNAVSTHMEWPTCSMADYDNDGEYEMAIIPHILHGTGYYEESLIIVDRSENDTWFAYHLPVDLYSDYFVENVEARVKNKKLELIFNGESVGTPVKVDHDDYNFNTSSKVDIFPCGDSILVNTNPYYYDENMGSALGEFYDTKLWLSISYNGAGEFEVLDGMSQPRAESLFEKEISKLGDDKFYGFIEGPAVETPLMIVSDSVIEQITSYDEDSVMAGHAPCFCDVYMMKGGKMTKIGEIEGSTNVYAIAYNEDAIVVREHHSVSAYKVENGKLVFVEGYQDDVVCAFDEKYEGFGRFDGKKFKKMSEKQYYKQRFEYAKCHDIWCMRGGL